MERRFWFCKCLSILRSGEQYFHKQFLRCGFKERSIIADRISLFSSMECQWCSLNWRTASFKIEEAYNKNLKDYLRDIPNLFASIRFVFLSNGLAEQNWAPSMQHMTTFLNGLKLTVKRKNSIEKLSTQLKYKR